MHYLPGTSHFDVLIKVPSRQLHTAPAKSCTLHVGHRQHKQSTRNTFASLIPAPVSCSNLCISSIDNSVKSFKKRMTSASSVLRQNCCVGRMRSGSVLADGCKQQCKNARIWGTSRRSLLRLYYSARGSRTSLLMRRSSKTWPPPTSAK